MAKYSDEFKLMVVREYLGGPLGFRLLVRKYDEISYISIISITNASSKNWPA